MAPDGVNKSVLLINGAFPAPTLEANWGDTFQITVHNAITGPEEGTSLHWHGILQRQTPWFDGVPSVQQCPIAPGKSLTYTFKADLYGTSWYHSHYSAQYAGGLFGPMIIHGPKNVPYDVDVGPLLLSDWFHTDYFSLVEQTVGFPPQFPPSSDNNLINGKMNYNCSLVKNGQACKYCFAPHLCSRLVHVIRGSDRITNNTCRYTKCRHCQVQVSSRQNASPATYQCWR